MNRFNKGVMGIKPKVSVITASLNSALTIRRTIESVLNQSYDNIEYIIIDGGSTDGTLDIIDEYRSQLSYFVSEKDNGIYDAFNKGIINASGDIIGIINSDDRYTYDAVETSVNELMDSDSQMCCGNIIELENEMIRGVVRSELRYSPWFGCKIMHPSVFVKKELYEEIGLFDTSYSIVADYKWMLEAIITGKRISYCNKEIAYFRGGNQYKLQIQNRA